MFSAEETGEESSPSDIYVRERERKRGLFYVKLLGLFNSHAELPTSFKSMAQLQLSLCFQSKLKTDV